ncbi:MAG: glycine cleavage system protein GcvH [Parvularculaceae bacterium]
MTTKYTKDHEWVRIDGDSATIGITAHAAEALGDVVFIELPDVGKSFNQGDDMAVVESVKAASDVYAPISGEVLAANGDIVDDPAKVNEDAGGGGWFVKLKMTKTGELDGLMDEEAYKEHAKNG